MEGVRFRIAEDHNAASPLTSRQHRVLHLTRAKTEAFALASELLVAAAAVVALSAPVGVGSSILWVVGAAFGVAASRGRSRTFDEDPVEVPGSDVESGAKTTIRVAIVLLPLLMFAGIVAAIERPLTMTFSGFFAATAFDYARNARLLRSYERSCEYIVVRQLHRPWLPSPPSDPFLRRAAS